MTAEHDTHVVRVSAKRTIRDNGTVHGVLAGALMVMRQGEQTPVTYQIGPDCSITLNDQVTQLGDLRAGDTVEIAHQSLAGQTTKAVSVSARRESDPSRWAILIAQQNYEDRSLSPQQYPLADAQLLHDTLVSRYKVPADQASLLTDESMVRLQQAIPERLARVSADGKLLVFFAGHAYKDADGKVYLAPKNFDLSRTSVTGLPLQWLVDEMEKMSGHRKSAAVGLQSLGDGGRLAARACDGRYGPRSSRARRALAAAHSYGNRELQDRPARHGLAGKTARAVRMAAGPGLLRRRRQERRQPSRANRTFRLSAGRYG